MSRYNNNDLVMEDFGNESDIYNIYKEREEAKRDGFISTPERYVIYSSFIYYYIN